MTVKVSRQTPESPSQKFRPVEDEDLLSESAKLSRNKSKGLVLSRIGSPVRVSRRPTGECQVPALPRPLSSSSTSSTVGRGSRGDGSWARRVTPLAGSLGQTSPARSPASNAIRHLDKKLSGEFQAFVRRQDSCPDFGAERARQMSPKFLSLPARRENFKKERYEREIERGAEAASAPMSPGAGTGVGGLPDLDVITVATPEAFMEDCKGLDQMIESCAKSLRFDHLDSNSKEDLQRAEREAAKRREEEAKRRARMKEKEARDPKKKVALRLENKRAFEMDQVHAGVGIPMLKLDVAGVHGHEQVAVVDVRQLRGKCQGLESGDGVKELLEQSRRREQWIRLTQAGASCMSTVSGASMTSPLGSSCFGELSQSRPNETCDERVERVRKRGEAEYMDRIMKKIGTMRAELPYPLPFDLEDIEGDDPCEQTLLPDGTFGTSAFRPRKSFSAGELSKRGSFGAFARARMTGHAGNLDAAAIGQLVAGGRRSRGSLELKRAQTDVFTQKTVTQKQARKVWVHAKALIKVLGLWFGVRRRNRSIMIARAFLSKMGEWARVRSAVHKLVKSARLLQGTWRAFAANKKRRCDIIQKIWQRVEDQHLSAYFKNLEQKLLHERQEAVVNAGYKKGNQPKTKILSVEQKSKQELFAYLESLQEDGGLALDWKAYRIPPRERVAIIRRYYMSHLKKHVNLQRGLMNTVMSAIRSQMEEIRFLKEFGHDPRVPTKHLGGVECHIAALPQLPSPAFWQISEQTALQLIALAAHALAHVEPFQEHPANKDLPEDAETFTKRGSRSKPKRTAFCRGSVAAPDGSLIDWQSVDFSNLDRHVQLGHLQKKPEKVTIPVVAMQRSRHSGKLDMEEVFRRFTPRLKEISDEQVLEYKRESGSTAMSPQLAEAMSSS